MQTIYEAFHKFPPSKIQEIQQFYEQQSKIVLGELKAMEQSLEAYKKKPNPSTAYIYVAEQRISTLLGAMQDLKESGETLLRLLDTVLTLSQNEMQRLNYNNGATHRNTYVHQGNKEALRTDYIINNLLSSL